MIATFIIIVVLAVAGIAAYSSCNLAPEGKLTYAIVLIVIIAGLVAYTTN